MKIYYLLIITPIIMVITEIFISIVLLRTTYIRELNYRDQSDCIAYLYIKYGDDLLYAHINKALVYISSKKSKSGSTSGTKGLLWADQYF